MKLLIVNDSEPTLRFLNEKVRWPQYGITQCFLADGARSARQILVTEDIDIVLCDIQMPDENGLQLIKWVCENGFDCECVFLTCYAKFEYAQEAIHLGCSDFILFPCPATQIGEAAQKVVERRLEQQNSDRLRQFGQYWLNERQCDKLDDDENGATPQQIIDEAVKFIMDNIASLELNVIMLSRQCCLSTSHFSRLFKKNTGLSASQFIIRERMQLALKLLSESNLSVGAIAMKVGYDNFPYFSAAFKKYSGATPTQYRENLQNKAST